MSSASYELQDLDDDSDREFPHFEQALEAVRHTGKDEDAPW